MVGLSKPLADLSKNKLLKFLRYFNVHNST